MEQSYTCGIKEAARLLNVEPSTLRYWEDAGLIYSDRNKSSNYRTYTLRGLFEASDIAFYRSMGVPIKDLVKSRSYSLEEMIASLGTSQKRLELRIEHLEEVLGKLKVQRRLAMRAEELIKQGVRQANPTGIRLVAYEGTSQRQWETMVHDMQRYALFIRADDPKTMIEGCIDFAGSTPAYDPDDEITVLWERKLANRQHQIFFEGAAFSGIGEEVYIDAESMFDEVRKEGYTPLYAVAHFLIRTEMNGRKDCYRVWIGCEGSCPLPHENE